MLVEIRGVEAVYHIPGRDPVQALDGVDLDLEAGEVVGLLGRNGAGKTTLMRVLLGLMHAQRGKVSVLGLNPQQERRKLMRLCGAILDGQRELPPRWTPADLLRFVGAGYGLSDNEIKKRGDHLLGRLGLYEVRNRIITTFSRGMKQKLSVVLALLHQPKLLVLDEPTLGLDVEATQELLHHIRFVVEEGCSVLISSHQLNIIERVSDRIFVIHAGRTIFQGTQEALVLQVGRGRVKICFECDVLPQTFIAALPEGVSSDQDCIVVPSDAAVLARVFAVAQQHGLSVGNVEQALDFENAFMALTEVKKEPSDDLLKA